MDKIIFSEKLPTQSETLHYSPHTAAFLKCFCLFPFWESFLTAAPLLAKAGSFLSVMNTQTTAIAFLPGLYLVHGISFAL